MKTKRIVLLAVTTALAAWVAATTATAQTATNIAYAKRDANNDFYPDDQVTTFIVTGRITSPNFATNRTEIFIQDTNDNIGIQVLGSAFAIDTNTFQLGYEITAEGQIRQTNGVRYVDTPFSFLLSVTDPTPLPPAPVQATLAELAAAAETNEGRLIEVTNVTINSGTWPNYGSSASLGISDGTGTNNLRIDADVALDGQLPPTNAFTLRGIFSQFDSTTNANSGYQIVPRFYSDLVQDVGDQPPSLVVINSNALYSVNAGVALNISVLGRDRNATDVLSITTPVAPGGSSITDLGERLSLFSWTPAEGDRGTTSTVTIAVTDGPNTSSVSLLVYVLTELQAGIILNEFQYDPDAVLGDANGDGVVNSAQDEFVEIVNNYTGSVDITGWTLRNGSNISFTFPTTILTSQTAVVVFGGGTPVGTFGYATVYASTSWVQLGNSGGIINLRDTNGTQVFSYDYTPLTDDPNQSYTRYADITGDYVQHLSANPAKRYSPGTQAGGLPFTGTGVTNTAPTLAAIGDTYANIGAVRTIAISATDNESDPIVLSMSNAPASAVLLDNGDGSGTFIYTGKVADAGTDFPIVLYARDASLAGSEAFRLSVPAPAYSGFLINEYMADPDASGVYVDANNDGVSNNVQDEFVEIINTTTGAVDMTGMMIYDGSQRRHTFTSVVVPSGGVMVVFSGGSIASFTNSVAQLASTGTLDLNNAADSIVLYSPATQMLDRVEWLSTAVGGESVTRYPDITGGYTSHYEVTTNTLRASPGRRVTGGVFVSDLPPILASIGNKAVTTGNSLLFSVTASDGDGDAITLVASNVPAGAAFGATNGVGSFSWPSAGPVGVYTTTFHAADNDGFDNETITITVNAGGGGGGSTNLLFVYDFDEPGVGVTNFKNTADGVITGLTLSGFESNDGASTNVAGNPGRAISDSGWNAGGLSRYWCFTITVDGAYTMAINTFKFDDQRSGSGPTNWFLRYSGDSFASDLGAGTNHSAIASSSNTLALSLGGISGSIEFRVYATNTGASAGTWRLDNVQVLGSLSPVGGGTDDDGDGLPNDWESLYFGGNTNADTATDSDGDGFDNLSEFIAVTIPTNGLSYLNVSGFTSGRALSFDSATGRNYTVIFTTNLLAGDGWTNLQAGVDGTGSPMTITDTNAADIRAYRLGVRIP